MDKNCDLIGEILVCSIYTQTKVFCQNLCSQAQGSIIRPKIFISRNNIFIYIFQTQLMNRPSRILLKNTKFYPFYPNSPPSSR